MGAHLSIPKVAPDPPRAQTKFAIGTLLAGLLIASAALADEWRDESRKGWRGNYEFSDWRAKEYKQGAEPQAAPRSTGNGRKTNAKRR